MFNVNGNGDTHESNEPREGFFLDSILMQVMQQVSDADAAVKAEMERWDGTLNADDIDKLLVSLYLTSKAAVGTALDAAGTDDHDTVFTAVRGVVHDCRVLMEKLRTVKRQHPHTLSVTPF